MSFRPAAAAEPYRLWVICILLLASNLRISCATCIILESVAVLPVLSRPRIQSAAALYILLDVSPLYAVSAFKLSSASWLSAINMGSPVRHPSIPVAAGWALRLIVELHFAYPSSSLLGRQWQRHPIVPVPASSSTLLMRLAQRPWRSPVAALRPLPMPAKCCWLPESCPRRAPSGSDGFSWCACAMD